MTLYDAVFYARFLLKMDRYGPQFPKLEYVHYCP